MCYRNSFITNFLIVCINVQASGTEYRCPFLSQTPPRLKNLPRFPFLSFTSNGRKTNGRHHSFEFLYTAILLPAANINPTPDRPVVCCHLKTGSYSTFWGCLKSHERVFFLQRNGLDSVKRGGNQEMMRGVHESLTETIFRHLPVWFGYISHR